MKWIALFVALITAVMLAAWPYVYVHRLDRALAASDNGAIREMVDLAAVRDHVRREIGERVDEKLRGEQGSVLGWIQKQVKRLGSRAVDIAIDIEWDHDTLDKRLRDASGQPLRLTAATTYAFYESWDRFLVTIGGDGKPPLHMRWEREGGRWRITALY